MLSAELLMSQEVDKEAQPGQVQEKVSSDPTTSHKLLNLLIQKSNSLGRASVFIAWAMDKP